MNRLEAVRRALNLAEREAVEHLNDWADEHPSSGTGGEAADTAALRFKEAAVRAFAEGRGTWRALAMQRLTAAFAESDPLDLKEALLDAAGLLIAWHVELENEKEQPKTATRTETGPDLRQFQTG